MKIKSIFLDTVPNLPRESAKSTGPKIIDGVEKIVDFKKRLEAKRSKAK